MNALWAFLRVRKRYWVSPIVILTALVAALVLLTDDSGLSQFAYTLF